MKSVETLEGASDSIDSNGRYRPVDSDLYAWRPTDGSWPQATGQFSAPDTIIYPSYPNVQ